MDFKLIKDIKGHIIRMDVRKILIESLQLLRSRPKAFIPRILTTAVYSFYTLYLMGVTASLSSADSFRILSDILPRMGLVFASLPLLYFMDILSYAMYPRIVADYREGREISLTAAFMESLKAWRIVLVLGAIIFGMLVVVVCAVAASVVLMYYTGSVIFVAAAAALVLALLLFFAVAVFFVVPAAVLDGRGVVDSFAESARLGFRYKGGIIKLNLVFVFLVVSTMLMVWAAQGDALLSAASVLVFVALRLVEAVVYTYLSVTNPYAYMQVRVNKSRVE